MIAVIALMVTVSAASLGFGIADWKHPVRGALLIVGGLLVGMVAIILGTTIYT